MKGFFLLFTISLLVMLQIQRGMMQTTTNPASTAQTTRTTLPTPARTPARTPAGTTAGTTAGTPARTPARTTDSTTMSTNMGTNMGTTARTLAGTPARTTLIVSPSASFATTKKHAGAAPTLSSLGGVSILIVLTNTFIQLFHLS